ALVVQALVHHPGAAFAVLAVMLAAGLPLLLALRQRSDGTSRAQVRVQVP
ncbi:MAG: hypothetical protein JWP39_1628, partial [Jatrophihabitans sp.]|nr:hypothetical protein [Jatrophihabitans sp.]